MSAVSYVAEAKDYIIYSIAQEIPMGEKAEVIKKNYYVNMGSKQGLKNGTVLNVYRNISRLDPYESKKRYSYRVKIGELEVLHSEGQAAITSLVDLDKRSKSPLFDIDGLMIGDTVEVKIN